MWFKASDWRCAIVTVVWLFVGVHAHANDVSHTIDEEIGKALNARNISAAPRGEDSEIARRLYLDIFGRIPSAKEARQYLEDSHPDKHHRLIDRLLSNEEMPFYWSTVFEAWLNGNLPEKKGSHEEFRAYLEHAIATNLPWNTLARQLLDPNPAVPEERAASYFLAVRLQGGDNAAKTDAMTSGVSTMFFGVQLQCAKCHDHPFVDEWKQENYYGLAAFLGRTQTAKVGSTTILKERADGEVTFINTDQEKMTAKMLFLDGQVFEEPTPPEDRNKWYTKGKKGLPDQPFFSRRQVLADYALTGDSPLFKRAIVNRIWKQLMGRGLVEPVDQMHEANPATHPELLNRLADDFAANGFDLRRLMAGILHSDAYLRSSRWRRKAERPSEADYAVAILKPLSPDQLALSIGMATGHFESMRDKYEREKQKRKIADVTSVVARRFYQRERNVTEIANRFRTGGEIFEANASQALFLSYNRLIQKQLESTRGSLVEQLQQQTDNQQAIRTAFLSVLGRLPSEDEEKTMAGFLGEEDRSKRFRELVWALLCSSEFRFNH